MKYTCSKCGKETEAPTSTKRTVTTSRDENGFLVLISSITVICPECKNSRKPNIRTWSKDGNNLK